MADKKSVNMRGVADWLRLRKTELIALGVAALLAVIDQVTKIAVASDFQLFETRPVIEGVFHLTYIHNDGAVFGTLSGMPYIFNTVTIIVVVVAIALMLLGKIKGNWLKWATAFIISGGTGNMIDRLRLGYVIDFIDIRCFGNLWVWIFNIADCFVVIGCIMLMIYFTIDMIKDYKKQNAAKRIKERENNDVNL